MKEVISRKIIKYTLGDQKSTEDSLVIEEPLEIRVAYHTHHGVYRTLSLTVTMRTPGDDESLARGFLFTEGIIQSQDDIIEIGHPDENIVQLTLSEEVRFDADNLKRNFYTTSSCGVCGKASIESIHSDTVYLPWKSELNITPSVLFGLREQLDEHQTTFKDTGGIHACALFDSEGSLFAIKEDVGRHNAMDKLIGHQSNYPISNAIVLLSGRASFELVQKASKAGIPIIVSIGAPSSLAVQLAEEQGMTLVGFLKNDSFNIYCGEGRVV